MKCWKQMEKVSYSFRSSLKKSGIGNFKMMTCRSHSDRWRRKVNISLLLLYWKEIWKKAAAHIFWCNEKSKETGDCWTSCVPAGYLCYAVSGNNFIVNLIRISLVNYAELKSSQVGPLYKKKINYEIELYGRSCSVPGSGWNNYFGEWVLLMFLEGGEMSKLAQKAHKNSAGYDSTQALIFWTCGSVPLSLRDVLCARGSGPPQKLIFQETEPRPLMREHYSQLPVTTWSS